MISKELHQDENIGVIREDFSATIELPENKTLQKMAENKLMSEGFSVTHERANIFTIEYGRTY